jgi:pimeloyl-ACP methyl ester carboxylesterase
MKKSPLIRAALALALLITAAGVTSCVTAPPLRDAHGNVVPGGLASLETVRLGGDEQWISIRARDLGAPLLLFLHGGPGSPEIPLTRYFLTDLEEHFIFVNWDQRGAGKSFAAGTPEKMTIDRFVEDTRELSELLLKRFHREKLYILGHSWGSLLGVLTVTRYPDLFYAYGGIGQYVEGASNEREAHRFALQQARDTGNEEAIGELTAIEGYPRPIDAEGRWFTELQTNRRWLTRFHAVCYSEEAFNGLAGVYLGAQEYSFVDIVNFVLGDIQSNRLLWPQIFAHDLAREAPRFKVPVYFFLGLHDYITPSTLAARYFTLLQAPEKRLYWFTSSAHCPNYEEPQAFQDAVVESFRQHPREKER